MRKLLLSMGVGAVLSITGASTAHAAYYEVFTSNIAADLINANDNYCSLAEAIKSVNDNKAVTNCKDLDLSEPGRISLVETPNKPFSTTHYVLNATLNPTRSVLITTSEEGQVAFIDSPGALALKVKNGISVSLYGLNFNHTGTGSGRLIWNAGNLSMASSTVRNGNVTTEPTGRGGGIYNEVTGNLSVYTSQVLKNSAKRGGGIYNDNGIIAYLDATISENSATIAGGGLYNYRSGTNANAAANLSATFTKNSAKFGGGVANVGGQLNVIGPTTIMSNSTVTGSVANNTTEICHQATCTPTNSHACTNGPCDGNGAGILNLDLSVPFMAGNINMSAPMTVSSNTAVGYGGAIYNTGQINIANTAMDGNKAKSGAAIFAAALLDSSQNALPNYCDVFDTGGPSSIGSNQITGTPANTKYSIVDSSGANGTYCHFSGVFAGGNTSPFCNTLGVKPGSFCPQ